MEALDKRKVLRQRSIDKEKVKAERKKFLADNLRKILKKEVENRTKDDEEFLEQHKTLAKKITKSLASREEKEDRKKEWEDEVEVMRAKCAKLAEAIRRSKVRFTSHSFISVIISAANRSIGSTTGCTITEKAPTRAFSWLKLGPRRNYHKGRAAIRHYMLKGH